MFQDCGVVLTVNKAESGTSAPNIVAVRGTETVMPMPVLVFDRQAQAFQATVSFDALAQKTLNNDFSQTSIAGFIQMGTVNG